MTRFQLAAALLACGCLTVAAGCGDSGDSSASNSGDTVTTAAAKQTTTAPESAPAAVGKSVKIISSDFGKVVADTKGEALYLFTKEKGTKSKCYGACAVAWPPMITKGDPRAGSGVKDSKLGTTTRRDGKKQVTYSGHPLYYYVHDSPGKILCQDVTEFGGIWYVVKPSGAPVT